MSQVLLEVMPKIIQAICSWPEAFTRMAQLLHIPDPPNSRAPSPPLPEPPIVDLEMAADHNTWPHHDRQDVSWVKITVTFCLTSAVEVALVSVQKGSTHLPPLFHLFSLLVFLAFSSLLVGKFMNSSKFPRASGALGYSGSFFTASAFVLAITIPFPLWLRCVAWAIYGISWSAIFVSWFL